MSDTLDAPYICVHLYVRVAYKLQQILVSFSRRPVVEQRGGIPVKIMEHQNHAQRGNKHGNGPEKPEQQSDGKIKRPKSKRPKLSSPDDGRLHVADRHIGVRHAYEIVGVQEVP
ncbi:unnamed protein product [Cuscuta epithymum]|uniref:Uncharacterized protein n=1 Tax=Cuscuta epithymum TaxID=186058 RepID=A0AAV0ENB2_9ASTE|nr:unnamed protein product [Cuscuta epithymum]